MPLFDVYAKKTSLKSNLKLEVVKVKVAKESILNGFLYLCTITNSTKKSALLQANTQYKSGLYSKVLSSYDLVEKYDEDEVDEPLLPKSAIYCDFNGVLDDQSKNVKDNGRDFANLVVAEQSCPHKVFKVLKLALETNSELILTSMWRTSGVSFYDLVMASIYHSDVEEYKEYLDVNDDQIIKLILSPATKSFGARTDEIRTHMKEHKITNCVVFEDTHRIDSDLNPIMTTTSIGLLDEHIEKAFEILKA